jgi:hypothetical protein
VISPYSCDLAISAFLKIASLAFYLKEQLKQEGNQATTRGLHF